MRAPTCSLQSLPPTPPPLVAPRPLVVDWTPPPDDPEPQEQNDALLRRLEREALRYQAMENRVRRYAKRYVPVYDQKAFLKLTVGFEI